MFRFVYAIAVNETPSDAAALGDFDGVERADLQNIDATIGRRVAFEDLKDVVDPPAYVSIAPLPSARNLTSIGHALRLAADRLRCDLLIESGGAFSTVHNLWHLSETVAHPRVKIAWNDTADAQPAVIVPTLNLRLGAVRLHDYSDRTESYIKRLAGIGFDGWLVIDPSEKMDRIEHAVAIIGQIRKLLGQPTFKSAAVAR